jgi:NAD(P)-dependent dehydrogenase (short-subunit alcohol dehydrogenase family)
MHTALVTGGCINTGVAIIEKFAQEGYNVLFTGRNREKVRAAEKRYQQKYPHVSIRGFTLGSLTADGQVDEQGVLDLFEQLDKENIFAAVEKEIECGVVVLDDTQLEKWNRVKQLTPLQQDVLFTYAQYKTKAAEIYGVSITYIYTLMKEIMVIVNGYSI